MLRYLDLVVLAIALPIFLVAGLPVLGWITAAVVWAVWRVVGTFSDRKAAAATDAKQMAGIAAGSMIGRGWLLGLILLGAGLAFGDEVGLSAAVLVFALFTIHFTCKLIAPSTGATTGTT